MVSRDDRQFVEFDASGVGQSSLTATAHALADLVLVALLTGLTVGLAVYYGEQGGPGAVRVPLGFLFVFFLPGYALTSALFPRKSAIGARPASGEILTGLERVVLAVGLSLALVPLVGLGLTLLSQPIGLHAVLLTLGVLTVGGAVVAAVRRLRILPRERFSISPRRTLAGIVQYSTANRLNVLLVFAIVLTAAGIGVAVVDSGEGDSYTEFSILSEDDDGELSAGDYPAEFTAEEPETLHVQVTNHEHRAVEYTVVVLLEDLDEDGDVSEREHLDRFTFDLGHGEQLVHEHEVEPTMTGENLRLTYLLYSGDVHENPAIENASLSTHLPVTVDE